MSWIDDFKLRDELLELLHGEDVFKHATPEDIARAAEMFDTPRIRREVEAWKEREKVAKKS